MTLNAKKITNCLTIYFYLFVKAFTGFTLVTISCLLQYGLTSVHYDVSGLVSTWSNRRKKFRLANGFQSSKKFLASQNASISDSIIHLFFCLQYLTLASLFFFGHLKFSKRCMYDTFYLFNQPVQNCQNDQSKVQTSLGIVRKAQPEASVAKCIFIWKKERGARGIVTFERQICA